MPFGAHETMEVHEILNEKINLINHFALYMNICQDPELRSMIDRHLRTALDSYNQLVAYTHDYSAAQNLNQPYGMPDVNPQQVAYGLSNPPSVAPGTHGQLSDTQIASAVLCAHKNSAKNHMIASLEIADPNLRQMLVNGAVACSNQAYEVFLFMNERGIYQVPRMNDQTAKTFLHSYQQAAEQQQAGMQQQFDLY
jgi:spore coat protein CotF